MLYLLARVRMSKTKLVVANWKMHGRLASNRERVAEMLRSGLDRCAAQVALCVPTPYLLQIGELIDATSIRLGAQDVSTQLDDGAYTGETSAAMLHDVRCDYVIVGHSERRSLFGESDGIVARKMVAVQSAGVTPILCIGETLAERDAGEVEAVLARQLDAALALDGIDPARMVVAYEPVWAIGTGRSADAGQIAAVHAFLRERLAGGKGSGVPLLYGGSVKPATADELFGIANVDGALVGGASLVAEDFVAICNSACRSED